jgi:hypothetical protein
MLDWIYDGKVYTKAYAAGIHYTGNSIYNIGRGIDEDLRNLIINYKNK